MLTPFTIFVTLATLSVTSGTYLISFPNSLIPGTLLKVRVLVQHSAGPVSVGAELKYVQNESLVAESTVSVSSGVSTTLSLNVPDNLLPSSYKLDVSGSGGLVFVNSSKIHFEEKSLIVFIQTDKSRYSAGQTVKYRAVFLLPNLLNFKGQASVTIQDGKDNKIEVTGPNQVTNGVISGQIELSRHPTFGKWKIVVDSMGMTFTKAFEVNDYVLPRFSVEITLPEEINSTQASFTIDVKAMFTFNTDVSGNCTILLYNEEKTWKNFELKKQLHGSVSFNVEMSKVNTELDVHSVIKVRAMVTDLATALTMIAERKLDIVFHKDYPVTINRVDEYKNSFIPGMTFRTKLFIARNNLPIGHSGSLTVTPTVTTAALETCNKGNPPYTWLNVQEITGEAMTILFDESGYADLSYLPDTPNAEKIRFEIEFNDPNIQPDPSLKTINLYALSTDLPVLRVNSNKFKTTVGDSLTLDVTATENISGNLTFEVYSRGIMLSSEYTPIQNASSKTHSITVTKDMIPRAYILVSHLTQSGYLAADYVVTEVDDNPLRNEVQVAYNATLLQPGQVVNISISADPFSTVYVLVEDKRNRLLGTDNDIFMRDVVRSVQETDYSTSRNLAKFQSNRLRKRNVPKQNFRRTKRSHGSFRDLDDVYMESGLVVLSDAMVIEKKWDLLLRDRSFERECVAPTTTSLPWGGGEEDNFYDMWDSSFFESDEDHFVLPTEPPGPPLGEIIRSLFPETWIWDEYNTGASGEINITKTVPDSMTTWVASVFAMNSATGIGVSESKPELTVKKAFFLTMDLPDTIIHKEEFLVQITAFNYYSVTVQVFLQITLSENPDSPIPAATIVNPGEGRSTYVHVVPSKTGELNVTAIARIGFFSVAIADAMTKTVTVRPNGVFRTTNEQHLIDVSAISGPVIKIIMLPDPEDMVEGTKITKISVTGNFMVPSIDGLDNLIRMPYGCGEQTMLNFAPAIYITEYLRTVGKLTPKIQEKSMRSLKEGLQRELQYQHYDGSFSAFGNSDPSGSSWLTAFVLKCFGQAEGLIHIDEAIMSKAMNWLLTYQQADGSFTEPGRVIHTEMQAGTASGITMTSFILSSLLENKNVSAVQGQQLNNAITNGTSYLESMLHTANDGYTLAVVCYALASAGSSSGSTCFTKLKNAAIIDDDKVYWKATRRIAKIEVGDRSLANRASSADVEASSYALLTYLKLDKTSEAFPIVKWLVSQRNSAGGYRSTQDTVISLQALSEFSSREDNGPLQDYNVLFKMTSFQNFAHNYSMTAANFDVVRSIKVPEQVENIIVQVTGEGSAVIDVSTSYYVAGNEFDDYIAVTASVTNETINTATVNSCLSWSGSEQSGMLLMEVEMPTGFQADNDQLKSKSMVKRHETNGRNIALYFDGLIQNEQVCVDVKMDRVDPVVKSQACHVTAYDYYDPVHQAMAVYEFGILKEATICVFCPLCNTCMGNEGGGQVGAER